MAYCAIADVQALNPQRPTYSSSTKPTSTQVEEFIDQIANVIDSKLSARSVGVPVTTPARWVSWLKWGNAHGAAAMAEMAMFPEGGGPGQTPHGTQLWNMYQKFLTDLETKELPVAGSKAGPRSMHTEEAVTETAPEATYPWQRPKLPKDREF